MLLNWSVISEISKIQKISTCYVMHALLLFGKTKQNGSIGPFKSSRVNGHILLPYATSAKYI